MTPDPKEVEDRARLLLSRGLDETVAGSAAGAYPAEAEFWVAVIRKMRELSQESS